MPKGLRTGLVATAVAVIVVAVCAPLLVGGQGSRVPGSDDSLQEGQKSEPDTLDGLLVRLWDAATAEAGEVGGPVRPEPLSEAEVQSLLARLPPLPPDTPASLSDRVPKGPQAPPAPGVTVTAEFPPPESPAPIEPGPPGPLAVLRYAPVGPVQRAGQVSVTFSQPMAPVTAHAELQAGTVPARLQPEPDGRWRWVGARTLLFEPADGFFAQATRYQVVIPAATTSEVGGRLPDRLEWSFSTPGPRMVHSYPRAGPVDVDPLIFLHFDQQVDTSAVPRFVKVESRGRRYGVRLAEPAETQEEREGSRGRRWRRTGGVSLRLTRALPRNSEVRVLVEPGIPSLEGPLASDSAYRFSFRTFGPMRLLKFECGQCRPGWPFYLEFSNPVDLEGLEVSQFDIEPEVSYLRLEGPYSFMPNEIAVFAPTQSRTTYRIRVSDVKDVFGQRLARDTTVTLRVGIPRARLDPRGGLRDIYVVEPGNVPTFSVLSAGLDSFQVRQYRVAPEDWQPYYAARRANRRPHRPWTPPGSLTSADTIRVADMAEETDTRIDLTPTLGGGPGHAILAVEPFDTVPFGQATRPFYAWVQRTELDLSGFADPGGLIASATRLADGAPLGGVEVSIMGQGVRAVTDSGGIATLQPKRLPRPGDRANIVLSLLAERGDDTAIVPIALPRASFDRFRWYTFTDRTLYRPGEDVRLKGWIRLEESGEWGDLEALPPGVRHVNYTISDARGNELGSGETEVSELGGFDLRIGLPQAAALGRASVRLLIENPSGRLMGGEHRHSLTVAEFRRPEFEVAVAPDRSTHLIGDSALFSLEARYFSGGALSDAPVRWTLSSRPTRYVPPGWSDFVFGGRGWLDGGEERSEVVHEARTGADGAHTLGVELLRADGGTALRLTAAAAVQDLNQQTWTESAGLLVHPGQLYVGLRSEKRWLDPMDPVRVDAIVTDLDGEPVPDRDVRLEAARVRWRYENGEWRAEELETRVCQLVSGSEPARCEFENQAAGMYRLRAEVVDGAGRPARTQLNLWSSYYPGRQRRPRQGVVEMIADRDVYQPGDTARVLVQAPFYPAKGVLTLRRSGILRLERFAVDGPTATLSVPIEAAHVPNLKLEVDLAGNRRTEERRPDADWVADTTRFIVARGALDLSVPPRDRALALQLDVEPAVVEPGGHARVGVRIRDAAGSPVEGAEVAVAVVDEAVWALAGDSLRDPLSLMYPGRPPNGRQEHLRGRVMYLPPPSAGETGQIRGAVRDAETGDRLSGAQVYVEGTGKGALTDPTGAFVIPDVPTGPQTLVAELIGYAAQKRQLLVPADSTVVLELELSPRAVAVEEIRLVAAAARMAGPASDIPLRSDFRVLAAFEPAGRTDWEGRLVIPVDVPDNLTRYRVIAVAAAGARQFGEGQASLTAGLPFAVRPSPPRFLNYGDRLRLPVVLENQTDSALALRVAVRATNLEWTGPAGLGLVLAPRSRAGVEFPAAAGAPGSARIQVAAAAGATADAAELKFPVHTPATSQAFAHYGRIDAGAEAILVSTPASALPDFGELRVTVASTGLHTLSDALLYLEGYPYECAEQVASRILGVTAMRDALEAFDAPGLPDPETIGYAVVADVARLASLQNGDGGFRFWDRSGPSWPYVSVHAAHALVSARQAGYYVPNATYGRAARYLEDIERHFEDDYPERVRLAITAYSLYVRDLMDTGDPARAGQLVREESLRELPVEAAGWLLKALAGKAGMAEERAMLRRHIGNRVTEEAGTAHFISGYGRGGHLVLYSRRRADAVLLDALIADQPENDLIPKLLRGLVAARTKGRWHTTQENVFALLALGRYFDVYESTPPNLDARIWLEDLFLGGHAFRGHNVDRFQARLPLHVLAERVGTGRLIVSGQGDGRLYYRVGLRYAPADLEIEPAEHGFIASRIYEPVDDPGDVSRLPDGTWSVRAGARVRVRLTLQAPSVRHHVALVDPLPAGFEIIDPRLRGDSQQERRRGMAVWWWRYWYDHENMRDDRLEAFASVLGAGVYDYTYLARATTRGEFVVPPVKAEEMYAPETFGHGASDRVIVR